MKHGVKSVINISGFTMIEVMITLVVVSILLSVAVPSLDSMIKNSRLSSRMNSIITDIHFSRSEAVKRGTTVIMCRSANPDAITPACGGTQKTWTDGYLVFADDGNHTNDVYDAGTDILLRRGEASTSGVFLRTNTAWDSNLKFTYSGATDENGSTAIMSICDDRGIEHGRQIQVMPSGIPLTSALTSLSCIL